MQKITDRAGYWLVSIQILFLITQQGCDKDERRKQSTVEWILGNPVQNQQQQPYYYGNQPQQPYQQPPQQPYGQPWIHRSMDNNLSTDNRSMDNNLHTGSIHPNMLEEICLTTVSNRFIRKWPTDQNLSVVLTRSVPLPL